MNDSITITLRLPPRELSPNWRGHWAAKAAKIKAYRSLAAWESGLEVIRNDWSSCRRATAQATFYHATRRRRDADNLLGLCKPIFDSLQDSGVIDNDSGLTHLPVQCEIDRDNPRVEITITRQHGG